jgi:hypothetical protein
MDKIKNIFLKDFIKNGNFGKIKIGQDKNDVINYLGNNYNKGIFDKTYILKWGTFEFFFWNENNKLYGIQNDSINYHEEINDDKTINFDMWFLFKGITLQETKNNLIKENIEFKQEKYKDYYEQIILKNKICLDFTNETMEDKIIENKNDYIFFAVRLFEDKIT